MAEKKTIQSFLQVLLVLGILLVLNILGNYFYNYYDLTGDKRYTLTEPTVQLLEELDDVVYVRVLLDGVFPADIKRLQKSVVEILDDFRSVSDYVEYTFEDPSLGTTEEINQLRASLAKDGIIPARFKATDNTGTTEKYFYPYAIVKHRGETRVINLLEDKLLGMPPEVAVNNSVSLLEYKLSNSIQRMQRSIKPAIAFTEGHGELTVYQTADLVTTLRENYNTGRLNLDSTYFINPAIKVVVVAKPRYAFSEKHKFMIDQYIMNGGKVIWLIDKLNAGLDSMQVRPQYIPLDYPLNLDDQFYKYGVRIQPNLVLDLEASRIPQVVGQQGGKPQLELMTWYYHPRAVPTSNHPIVKNLDAINFSFPSSIDTIRTKTNVGKTILLQSSRHSKLQFSPVRLGFEILRYEPDPSKFNKPFQNLAVLLEGEFPSLYENRVTQGMRATLNTIGKEYKSVSAPTKMMFVSDGDVTKNLIPNEGEEPRPLGFNKFERYVYANKDFMINAIEYMLDENGVIEARSKEVKLRRLDTVRVKAEKTQWQLVNIVLPLVLLIVFGFIYNFIRKKRFA